MHPLRVIVDHHVIVISGLLGTVSGDRNRKRCPQSWQGSLVRWSAPLPAAVAIAAEAEPAAILLRQMIRPAPRCTRVIGAVEATTARASLLPSRIGQVLVNRQKERPETPSSMQLMPHHGVLLGLKPLKEDTPCEGARSITLIDGGYRQNLE